MLRKNCHFVIICELMSYKNKSYDLIFVYCLIGNKWIKYMKLNNKGKLLFGSTYLLICNEPVGSQNRAVEENNTSIDGDNTFRIAMLDVEFDESFDYGNYNSQGYGILVKDIIELNIGKDKKIM